MAPSPQHPEPRPRDLSGAVAEDLAMYRATFQRRLAERYEAKCPKVVKRFTGDEDDLLAFFDSPERGRPVERREGVAA